MHTGIKVNPYVLVKGVPVVYETWLGATCTNFVIG